MVVNYLKFALFAPLSFLINVISYPLSLPLATLSVVLGRDTLPGFLKYFHTHNDTLDGGQHQHGWPKAKGLKLIWQRAGWICRNPGYGFDAYVFGIPEGKAVFEINRGKHGTKEFFQKGYIESNGQKYFFIRKRKYWFGWNQYPSMGRHIFKFSLRNIL